MIEKAPDGAVVSVGELGREFPAEPFEPRARFHARKVILALPPRLAAASILFEPDLPHNLAQAMLKTGTWMAGQAKFCALYEKPFWRQNGLSGEAFSQRGPLGEIHDGSAHGTGPHGFSGFVGVPAARRKQQKGLVAAMIDQLGAIFGEPEARPTAFFFQDWARERFTATAYDQPPMVEHPVYSPSGGSDMLLGRHHPFRRNRDRRPSWRLPRRGPDRGPAGGGAALKKASPARAQRFTARCR